MSFRRVGRIEAESLDEASGMVVSRRNPGVAWLLNDSGGDAALVAIDLRTGKRRATLTLAGARNTDWEALALDPNGRFVAADIGDNGSSRRSVDLYRATEPGLAPGKSNPKAPAQALRLTFPDGARDAETLLCDPKSGALLLVTKDPGGHSALYRVPESGWRTGRATLIRVGGLALSLPTGGFGPGGLRRALGSLRVTDGAVSPDGRTVALLTYGQVLRFRRDPRQPLEKTLAGRPQAEPVPQELEQAEAIAYGPDGRLWLTGEGEHPPLFVAPK